MRSDTVSAQTRKDNFKLCSLVRDEGANLVHVEQVKLGAEKEADGKKKGEKGAGKRKV
jgi:hypothetical protein